MDPVHHKILEGRYKNILTYSTKRKDEEAYNKWEEEERRLIGQLRSDLAQEHGLTGHPKEEIVWRKAWEDGHSAGFSEVATAYEGLVELVL